MNKILQENMLRRLSPFHHKQAAMGATFTRDQYGWLRAENFAEPNDEREIAERGVGLCDLSHLAKLSIQSRHMRAILSGMYGPEKDVPQAGVLTDGPGALKDVLCAIISKDEALFIMNASSKERVSELAGTNASRPFAVDDVTSLYAGAFLVGEKSRQVLSKLAEVNINDEDFHNLTATHVSLRHVPSILMRTDLGRVTGFQVYFERAYSEYLWDITFGAGKEFGMIPVGNAALRLMGWTLG